MQETRLVEGKTLALLFRWRLLCHRISSLRRHIREQSGRHPGPVRRRLHWQCDWQQRGQRVPGHRCGLDHRHRVLAQQRQTVQGEPGLPGLLRHPLHHHGAGVRAGAALPPARQRVGRRAGGPTDSQAHHLLPVHLPLVRLHPASVAGGVLPRPQLLKLGPSSFLPKVFSLGSCLYFPQMFITVCIIIYYSLHTLWIFRS